MLTRACSLDVSFNNSLSLGRTASAVHGSKLPVCSALSSSRSVFSTQQLDVACNRAASDVQKQSQTSVKSFSFPPALPARGSRICVKAVQHEQTPATAGPSTPSASSTQTVDPFIAASRRLQSLLANVPGDGDEEMVDNIISEESPERRLQMQVVLSGIITMVAVAVSLLCGQDPWGGASLSLDSLMAAGIGGAVALPLVALRAFSWTPEGQKALPQLHDVHIAQIGMQSVWYERCHSWHVATMLALEVLPVTLLLLPAAQGGLLAAANMYTSVYNGVGGGGEAAVTPESLQLACLLITAGVASLGKGLELGVSDQEYEVVQSAMDNADRYYRLTSQEGGSSAAALSALAFRSVAQAWMQARNEASFAALALCFADVMVLGGAWYGTHNLIAPAVAALAINAVDYHNVHQVVLKREKRIGGGSGGGSGKGKTGGNNGSNPPQLGA